MRRLALLAALALMPLAPEAQTPDPLLGIAHAAVAVAQDEDDGTVTCGGESCLGSEEDQTACYVVAGIAAAAFGTAAIVGLVREGNPCAYIGWGDCGECKDPDRAAPSVDDEAPPPRRGVGLAPEARPVPASGGVAVPPASHTPSEPR